MDYATINKLLDHYWEGKTSLEDEQDLKIYFAQETIAPDHLMYQSYFKTLDEKTKLELDADFDTRLLNQIQSKKNPKKISLVRRLIPRLVAAAAVVLLILSSTYLYQQYEEQQLAAAEKKEAIEAYEKVKAALLLTSSKIKKGTSPATEGLSKIKVSPRVLK